MAASWTCPRTPQKDPQGRLPKAIQKQDPEWGVKTSKKVPTARAL